jgi:hypothetical protein
LGLPVNMRWWLCDGGYAMVAFPDLASVPIACLTCSLLMPTNATESHQANVVLVVSATAQA